MGGASAAVRGGGFVLLWFTAVAVGVFACSKETPPPPTTTPVASAGPAAPGSSPSNAVWASESAAPSASSAAAASAVASETVSATATVKSSAPANVPVTASAPSGPKEFACGGGDKPKCPLQGWMNTNMKPAMSSGDPAKVAALMRKIAGMAPASYGGWAKIANDGAAEVEAKKEVNAAKPFCSKCHEQFKSRWKAEDRDRAI